MQPSDCSLEKYFQITALFGGVSRLQQTAGIYHLIHCLDAKLLVNMVKMLLAMDSIQYHLIRNFLNIFTGGPPQAPFMPMPMNRPPPIMNRPPPPAFNNAMPPPPMGGMNIGPPPTGIPPPNSGPPPISSAPPRMPGPPPPQQGDNWNRPPFFRKSDTVL